MNFNDELNPKIWNKDDTLRDDVKEHLTLIANDFIEYMDIPKEAVKDILIVGSSANYNYNEYSDLDLHIRVDYDKIHEDCPIVEDYLWAVKALYNNQHDITIRNIPIELYAENYEQPANSNGVYSIVTDKWIKKPEKIKPTDNDMAVESKYLEIKEVADSINDANTAKDLLDRIYVMRKEGLSDEGEYGTSNLAFKKLRNSNTIERLKKLIKDDFDEEMSISENRLFAPSDFDNMEF